MHDGGSNATVRPGPRWALLVVVCAAVLLGGCGRDEPDDPGYSPVPDDQLYSRIAELPEVTDVDVDFVDDVTNGRTYIGGIEVTRTADPLAVLDQAIAILRQGRYRASMGLSVLRPAPSGKLEVTYGFELGIAPSEPDLTERYGPQPGTGQPPETPPTP